MKKSVVACVVTYNRKDKLKKCIDSLLQQDFKNLDILIVDNGSNDGTRDYILPYIDDELVMYVNTNKNLGGAGGFNYAIKSVVHDYEYIWIMDDDTYPHHNALSSMIKHIPKDGKFGFFSSLVEWTDGNACLMNKQLLVEDIFDDMEALRNGMIPVKSASFVSLFISSQIVKEIGLPIKEFFLWGDDTEYTGRLHKFGGYLVLDSIVTHDMVSNDGIDIVKNSYERTKRYNLFIRNRVYIAKKRNAKKEVLKAYLSALKQIIRILFFAKDHKVDRIKSVIKGVCESICFNPDIEFVE